MSTAGIHTDIALKDEHTYHINGDTYGATPMVEFGPTSGGNQLIPILKDMGIDREKSHPDVIKFTNMLKEKCNNQKRALNETDIMYAAIHFFDPDFKDPLEVTEYRILTTKTDLPKVEIEAKYNGEIYNPNIDLEQGSVEAILSAFNTIIQSQEQRDLRLVDFITEVIPKIPEMFLMWRKGRYPLIPKGLDIHSDFRVTAGIRDDWNGGRIFYGTHTGEDSFKTIIE